MEYGNPGREAVTLKRPFAADINVPSGALICADTNIGQDIQIESKRVIIRINFEEWRVAWIPFSGAPGNRARRSRKYLIGELHYPATPKGATPALERRADA